MTDFLNSLKTDLLDSRMRLVLGLLAAGLIAALVYAATGGGGAAPVPPATTSISGPGYSGIAASAAATNPNEAVAEVTSGAAVQRRGLARDPFAVVPGVVPMPATTTTTTTASSSSASSSRAISPSSSSSASSTGRSEVAPSKSGSSGNAAPKHHAAKPQTVYKVSVQLGPVPAGTAPQNVQLTAYKDLLFKQELPSPKQPLVSFAGVTPGGHRAAFKLVAEAILRGQAACAPSASQCEAIALRPGQSEELEYVQPGVAPVVYLLRVEKIEAITAAKSGGAKAAGAAHVARRPLLDETGHAHSPAAVVLVREVPARPTVDTVVVVPQGG
jgi:hypothetical protein